eukprot:8958320-Lingulodinium_polyedra.AAC.1
MLDNAAAAKKPLCFPRGVAVLHGTPTKSVPYYAIVDALAHITRVDKTTFINLADSKKECGKILLYACGVEENHQLPERKMLLNKFFAWCEEMYFRDGQKRLEK